MPSDLAKSLEQLEGSAWGDPDLDSHLVRTCHALRAKPIGQFSTEDLRIMLGQQIGVRFLMPLAVAQLEANPFAEGDFYPGDLLRSVIRAYPLWAHDSGLVSRMRHVALRAVASLTSQSSAKPDAPDLSVDLATELAAFLGAWLTTTDGARSPSKDRR